MKRAICALASISMLALTSPLLAKESSVAVQYLSPVNDQEQQILKAIKDSGVDETLMSLADLYFPFNNPLTIKYGSDDGPLYDPESHQVHIPYEFYLQSEQYFDKNLTQSSAESAQEGANATLLHTLLHEAGHAYIADQNIPILGKEEDAVDNFATLLLLNYVEGGDSIAINAADMFAFESEDKPEYYEFDEYIDEHSFDLQRYFSTLCLVYGYDPEAHPKLLDEIEKDYLTERKGFCEYHYQSLDQNWSVYLKTEREAN
ncbi:hypothetical protein J4N42_22355 [Vibrio sp. SCSIO 43135]|uniref:DUF4344 domain-containing metallopeptidase n=1 Tax=Vibrio sp. SCSIO 43135 TaxID=2819096 RepID=UPI002074C320|nr:DUF4344 domain-containing metallopeptidase [Vibrio sp. SCSIO 43135]USD43329.1 hypothetical protein J4N42_22355 [Vibrio sp. SCSIO 43135]